MRVRVNHCGVACKLPGFVGSETERSRGVWSGWLRVVHTSGLKLWGLLQSQLLLVV